MDANTDDTRRIDGERVIYIGYLDIKETVNNQLRRNAIQRARNCKEGNLD